MAFILGITGGVENLLQHNGSSPKEFKSSHRCAWSRWKRPTYASKNPFGDWVLQPDGNLDRRALIFFKTLKLDKRLRKSRIQPIYYSTATKPKKSLCDFTLLFETNQHELVNHTLLVVNKLKFSVQASEMGKIRKENYCCTNATRA